MRDPVLLAAHLRIVSGMSVGDMSEGARHELVLVRYIFDRRVEFFRDGTYSVEGGECRPLALDLGAELLPHLAFKSWRSGQPETAGDYTVDAAAKHCRVHAGGVRAEAVADDITTMFRQGLLAEDFVRDAPLRDVVERKGELESFVIDVGAM